MRCDTEAEFNYCWERLVEEYNCAENSWLVRLYRLKEKWCPAFGKVVFSGGILSSQRSQSTNSSLSKRVNATCGLFDFYNIFCDVLSEWRIKEKDENVKNRDEFAEMYLPHVSLLQHAYKTYTNSLYKVFENEYIKGEGCCQDLLSSNETPYGIEHTYVVYENRFPKKFGFVVRFNLPDQNIICDCKKFTESGILYCHCLRIFNVHCVPKVPDQYIVKRWTRVARPPRAVEEVAGANAVGVPGSLWRVQMHRQFESVLLASECNIQARKLCEEAFANLKADVSVVVGSVYVADTENEQQSSGCKKIIGNPKGSQKKGERNVRRKSTSDKISNIVRARKARFSSSNGVDVSQGQVVGAGASNPVGASNPSVDLNEMYRVFSLVFEESVRQPNGGGMLANQLNFSSSS